MRASESSQDHVGHNNEGSSTETTLDSLTHSAMLMSHGKDTLYKIDPPIWKWEEAQGRFCRQLTLWTLAHETSTAHKGVARAKRVWHKQNHTYANLGRFPPSARKRKRDRPADATAQKPLCARGKFKRTPRAAAFYDSSVVLLATRAAQLRSRHRDQQGGHFHISFFYDHGFVWTISPLKYDLLSIDKVLEHRFSLFPEWMFVELAQMLETFLYFHHRSFFCSL